MKITQIDIADYQQFKNITFDFTYPQGHPRAGEPMDKVCFIGQSGTGKTTLLEVIRGILYSCFETFNIESKFLKSMNNFKILNDDKEYEKMSFPNINH